MQGVPTGQSHVTHNNTNQLIIIIIATPSEHRPQNPPPRRAAVPSPRACRVAPRRQGPHGACRAQQSAAICEELRAVADLCCAQLSDRSDLAPGAPANPLTEAAAGGATSDGRHDANHGDGFDAKVDAEALQAALEAAAWEGVAVEVRWTDGGSAAVRETPPDRLQRAGAQGAGALESDSMRSGGASVQRSGATAGGSAVVSAGAVDTPSRVESEALVVAAGAVAALAVLVSVRCICSRRRRAGRVTRVDA